MTQDRNALVNWHNLRVCIGVEPMTGPAASRTKKSVRTLAKAGASKPRARNRSGESARRQFTLSDGREVRRLTVYLPATLAKRLAKFSAEHDKNMSDVLSQALAEYLAR